MSIKVPFGEMNNWVHPINQLACVKCIRVGLSLVARFVLYYKWIYIVRGNRQILLIYNYIIKRMQIFFVGYEVQDKIIIILSFNRHILEKTFIIVRFVNNNLFLISKIEYYEMIIKHYILLRPLAEIVNQKNPHCYSLLLMETPYTFVVKLWTCVQLECQVFMLKT